LLLTVIAVYPAASATAVAAERKRVILLHSFGQEFRPWSEAAKSIRSELTRQSPWPLDIDNYSLAIARSGDDNPERPFVEYLSALYSTHPPDLIISVGAPAADFVQRNRRRLFPSTPMVITSVEQRRVRLT
jgi:hypothetical protein